MDAPPSREALRPWHIVSAVGVILSLVAAAILILFAPRLARYGLTRPIFLGLAVGLALCSSAFLIGALKGYARFTGHNPGRFELGGPPALFFLILIFGFRMAGPGTSITLVIRFHDSSGFQNVIDSGQVLVDIGTDRRSEQIENGQAQFNQIPVSFAAEKVSIIPQIPDYDMTQPTNQFTIPDDGVIYVALSRKSEVCELQGFLRFPNGSPVVNADLAVDYSATIATQTDSKGHFDLSVPKKCGEVVQITATLDGKVGFDRTVTLPGKSTLRFELQ